MAEGGYQGHVQRIARVLRVTTEGVWLDMMSMTTPYDIAESQATIYACAAAFFPRHFGPEGLLYTALTCPPGPVHHAAKGAGHDTRGPGESAADLDRAGTGRTLGRRHHQLSTLSCADARAQAVVRIGDDIPLHQILRFNELAASRAAHAAGVSPAVLHHEPGVLVIDFIEGRTLTAADLRQDAALLDQALALILRAHQTIPHIPARPGADVLGVPCDPRLCRHPARRGQPRMCRCCPRCWLRRRRAGTRRRAD